MHLTCNQKRKKQSCSTRGVRLSARIHPFQGYETGSTPVRPTIINTVMITFKDFLEEQRLDPKSHTLHAFDIDETLFKHSDKLKVHVNDSQGKRVKSLSNTEYNTHKLEPGHSYDFSEFKSSRVFNKTARPIHSMIAKMNAIHRNNKNVEILTARSDFDNKEKFKNKMGKHGIDIDKIHVRRAGNLNLPAPEAKKSVISDLIKKHGYKKIHLYDDSKANIDSMLSLKKDHPDVEFHGHHVVHGDGGYKINHYSS